ncbi:protein BTG3 [Biomphalaria glabrata]|uniref:Protein BTG3-like n=1 Tax=Biomphalaria glabrata TaxID=6526 RepID=A0A2C9JIF4_BIOGL|nr:protein BTG3-like [Biomphalaria glabrata]XP_013068869.1 protein BTG3-like [Biomphalaria glabrata]KAI8729818.1 protein BTG3-like [Biomphalaria glabrata]KAI8771555.1 protein BTG3 [Biomphalaria glabrata]
MRKEIDKAVETFHRIVFGTKKNGTKNISESKLASFVAVLTELLLARYQNNWFPENPERGSGFRCIRVNTQSIDPTILECLKRSKVGIPKSLSHTELTIWVDPGVVSVRIGEDGSIGSEIIDEELYKTSLKLSSKRSASESDEGFSSRSSSPDSSISERSGSVSPSLRRSPVQTPASASCSPTPLSSLEYNPYSPPVQVSYPNRYHPSPPQTPSHQLNVSPSPRNFQASGSQGRLSMPQAANMTPSQQGDYLMNQGHIPVSSTQRTPSYTRPRALFPSNENGTASMIDGFGKLAFNPYSMSVNYGTNLLQPSFYDIPAMA